jgi:hypothetical protein
MPNYDPNDINARLALLIQNAEETKDFRRSLTEQLQRIEAHCEHTNGSIADAQRDIAELKDTHVDLKQLVTFKNFIQTYLLNRYFLIVLAVFGLGLFKALANEQARGFLLSIVGAG